MCCKGFRNLWDILQGLRPLEYNSYFIIDLQLKILEKGQLQLALHLGWIAVLTGLQFSPMLQWFLARILRKFLYFLAQLNIGSFFPKMLAKNGEMWFMLKFISELTGICRNIHHLIFRFEVGNCYTKFAIISLYFQQIERKILVRWRLFSIRIGTYRNVPIYLSLALPRISETLFQNLRWFHFENSLGGVYVKYRNLPEFAGFLWMNPTKYCTSSPWLIEKSACKNVCSYFAMR